MKTILIGIGLVTAMVMLAATPSPKSDPAALVKEIGASTLAREAWTTHARWIKSAPKPGTDVPPASWSEAIRRLHPQRVYFHRVNLVAVLETRAGAEAGLYIYIPISSYLPRSGDDGFTFTPMERDICQFTRNTNAPVKP